MAFRIAESRSVTNNCREKGRKRQKSRCRIQLPNGCVVYCAETLRDEIVAKLKQKKQPPVCDCIVRISDTRISLVELKRGGPRDDVVGQFNGGISLLKYIMDGHRPISLQAVLLTNREFIDRSEEVVLATPLAGVVPPVTISKRKCGDALPDGYVPNCRY